MSEAERWREVVWRSEWKLLRRPLEATARASAVGVFLVGGYVRDLLLGRQPVDFDLTVDGDGVAFARQLAVLLGAQPRVSDRFLTAEIALPDGRRVDVTTARSEAYAHPGALPSVTPADLPTDLRRRDFTVNTFALALAGSDETELLSVDGARADLEAGVLRPLHEGSFDDDPTRILRAVRQEIELDFRLTAIGGTMARQAMARGALTAVSGERLWRDLEPAVSNCRSAAPALQRLEELGVLRALLDGLRWSPAQQRQLDASLVELERLTATRRDAVTEASAARISLLILASGPGGFLGESLAERLHLGSRDRQILSSWSLRRRAARSVVGVETARPSEVHAALRGLSIDEMMVLVGSLGGSRQGSARDWVRRELEEFRCFESRVRPADLLARGYAAGPAIGQALERTMAARLDGRIGDEDEIEYALGVLEALAAPDDAEE